MISQFEICWCNFDGSDGNIVKSNFVRPKSLSAAKKQPRCPENALMEQHGSKETVEVHRSNKTLAAFGDGCSRAKQTRGLILTDEKHKPREEKKISKFRQYYTKYNGSLIGAQSGTLLTI